MAYIGHIQWSFFAQECIAHIQLCPFQTEMMRGRSAYLTSNCAPLNRDDERQECIPASLGCKANRVVGDGSPDEGLDKGDRQAHDGGGDHKGPAGEEEIISLLEEDFNAVNLQITTMGLRAEGGIQHHMLCICCVYCTFLQSNE